MRVPWADLVLFAAIAIVLAVWWLHSPESPETSQGAQSGQQTSKTPTAALVAALELDDPTTTPQPTPTSTPTATVVPQETPDPVLLTPAGPIRHKVKPGDNPSTIAALYGSNVNDILQANSLSAKAVLSIGQELLIPVPGGSGGDGPTATPGPTGLMVTVKEGDTVSGLAERHKSRVDWIVKANNLQPGETLHIGRGLLIPLTAETPTSTPTVPATPIPDTPTATPGFLAPELLTPGDDAIISGEDSVLLSWTSVGVLASKEWYVVTLRSPKQETPIVTWWTKSTSWRLPAEYRPTSSAGVDYTWRVQVRRGEVQQPGEAVSPVSAGRRFTWR